MHSVWLAAKIASGQASSRIERTPRTRQEAVVLPGRDGVEHDDDAAEHERRVLGEARAPARPGGLLDDGGDDLRRLGGRGRRGPLRRRCVAAPELSSCRRHALLPPRLQQPGDEHDEDDDHAAGRLGVARVPAEPEHDRRDQRQAQGGEHRAGEPADAAGEGDAAEHGGGDAVQRGVVADRRPGLAAAGVGGDDDAGEAGEQPADRVGEHPGAGDGDARQERRLAVAADGVDAEPEAAEPQRDRRSARWRRASTAPTARSCRGCRRRARWKSGDVPPPGPPMTNRARPDSGEAGGERDDDVGHAGDRERSAGQRRERRRDHDARRRRAASRW